VRHPELGVFDLPFSGLSLWRIRRGRGLSNETHIAPLAVRKFTTLNKGESRDYKAQPLLRIEELKIRSPKSPIKKSLGKGLP
jgi:hypothetical protein